MLFTSLSLCIAFGVVRVDKNKTERGAEAQPGLASPGHAWHKDLVFHVDFFFFLRSNTAHGPEGKECKMGSTRGKWNQGQGGKAKLKRKEHKHGTRLRA